MCPCVSPPPLSGTRPYGHFRYLCYCYCCYYYYHYYHYDNNDNSDNNLRIRKCQSRVWKSGNINRLLLLLLLKLYHTSEKCQSGVWTASASKHMLYPWGGTFHASGLPYTQNDAINYDSDM